MAVWTNPAKALAALNGLGGGLNAGAIGAVSAATLPDVENSARDMNILVTGPVFGQMALQAGGGYVIGWASQKWSPAVAWSVMWCAENPVVRLHVAVCSTRNYQSASHRKLSLPTCHSSQRFDLRDWQELSFEGALHRLVSGGFFLLAIPTLIPIRPVEKPASVQNSDEEMKPYRKAHDYRRGGLGGRY